MIFEKKKIFIFENFFGTQKIGDGWGDGPPPRGGGRVWSCVPNPNGISLSLYEMAGSDAGYRLGYKKASKYKDQIRNGKYGV